MERIQNSGNRTNPTTASCPKDSLAPLGGEWVGVRDSFSALRAKPHILDSKTDGVASYPASSPLFPLGRACLPINLAGARPFSTPNYRGIKAVIGKYRLIRPRGRAFLHPSIHFPLVPSTITLYRQISVNNAYDRLITVNSPARALLVGACQQRRLPLDSSTRKVGVVHDP